MTPTRLLSALALCFGFPTAVSAQELCRCEHRAAVHATVWVGATTESRHFWLGFVEDATVEEIGTGLTWSHPIASELTIEAAVALLPYVKFEQPAGDYQSTSTLGEMFYYSSTTNARGWGIIPLDVGLRAFTRSRVNATAGVFFGVVWFNRPVPNTLAEKRNYLFGVRGGIEVPLNSSSFVFASTRVQHLSYGGAHPANQGVENLMFLFGYAFKVR